jgi:steroid 5-alpha reductase family enzyme
LPSNVCADPNYFGEQLWWWSFAGFAVRLGEWPLVAGTAFNSVVLATVTLMTEERMLSRWTAKRAALYREYMRTTSPCIPWFKRA